VDGARTPFLKSKNSSAPKTTMSAEMLRDL